MPHRVNLSLVTRLEKDWLPAFHLLSDVAMTHGKEFSQITVSSVDLDDIADEPEDVEEYHDEKTLGKVYDAARPVIERYMDVNHREDMLEEIVNAMQNAGILFREIKK